MLTLILWPCLQDQAPQVPSVSLWLAAATVVPSVLHGQVLRAQCLCWVLEVQAVIGPGDKSPLAGPDRTFLPQHLEQNCDRTSDFLLPRGGSATSANPHFRLARCCVTHHTFFSSCPLLWQSGFLLGVAPSLWRLLWIVRAGTYSEG